MYLVTLSVRVPAAASRILNLCSSHLISYFILLNELLAAPFNCFSSNLKSLFAAPDTLFPLECGYSGPCCLSNP